MGIDNCYVLCINPPVAITASEIKSIRNRLEETQAVFGQRFGVDQSTIHRWETDGVPEGGTSQMLVSLVLSELIPIL